GDWVAALPWATGWPSDTACPDTTAGLPRTGVVGGAARHWISSAQASPRRRLNDRLRLYFHTPFMVVVSGGGRRLQREAGRCGPGKARQEGRCCALPWAHRGTSTEDFGREPGAAAGARPSASRHGSPWTGTGGTPRTGH